jgi:hypothetical protein
LAAKDKVYWSIIVVLVLVIAAMAYKFVVAGATQDTSDGRRGILLEPGERALVVQEMRRFVSGLQRLVDALARDSMHDVANAARSMGNASNDRIPGTMLGKLPLQFKALALSTHSGFDTIAMDAEWIALPQRTLGQLAELLGNCEACHDTYRIVVTTSGAEGQ